MVVAAVAAADVGIAAVGIAVHPSSSSDYPDTQMTIARASVAAVVRMDFERTETARTAIASERASAAGLADRMDTLATVLELVVERQEIPLSDRRLLRDNSWGQILFGLGRFERPTNCAHSILLQDARLV